VGDARWQIDGKGPARPAAHSDAVDPLLLVRRVPAHRLAVTRRITAHWGTPAITGVQWWELVDPVCDDEQPAAALAAVQPDGSTFRLIRLAAPPGRHDLAVQVLQGLVDALRAGPAQRLAAALPPHGHDLLRQAGFRQHTDTWAVDL
jgi:hypothetical protein